MVGLIEQGGSNNERRPHIPNWVFFLLAAFLAAGIGSIVAACFMNNTTTFIPILLFPLLIFCPLPVAFASLFSDDTLFSSQKSGPAVEFGFFVTGMILTSIFALPLVFWHVGRIVLNSALLSILGAVLIMIAGFTYQVVYNSSSSYDN